MYNQYNIYNLEAKFVEYLERNNFSRTSIHNYRGDIRKFISWYALMLNKQGMTFDLSSLTKPTLELYKQHMLDEKVPVKTANRRLSTIRTFAKSCLSEGVIASNPFAAVANMQDGGGDDFSRAIKKTIPVVGIGMFGFLLVIGLFFLPSAIARSSQLFGNFKLPNFLPVEKPAVMGSAIGNIASTSADLLTIPIIDESGSLNLTAPYPNIKGHTGTLTIEGPQVEISAHGKGSVSLVSDGGPVQFLYSGEEPPLPFESAFYFAGNDINSGTLMHVQTETTKSNVSILELSSGLPAVTRFKVDAEGNVHIRGNIILDGNLIMSPDSVIFGNVSNGTVVEISITPTETPTPTP